MPLLTHANSYCYVYMSSANLLEIVESLSSRKACIFLDEITYFMLLPNGINLNTILINNIMYVNISLRNIQSMLFMLFLPRNAHSFRYFAHPNDIIYRLISQSIETVKIMNLFFFVIRFYKPQRI